MAPPMPPSILHPWLGTCPHCGKSAVFREEAGRVLGACCGGGPCWWAGEVDEFRISSTWALGAHCGGQEEHNES